MGMQLIFVLETNKKCNRIGYISRILLNIFII